MNFLLAIDGAPVIYPASRHELQSAYPTTIFGESLLGLEELGFFPVTPVPQPTGDPRLQRVEEGPPELVDGSWSQTWITRPATQAEVDAYDAAMAPAPDYVGFQSAALSTPEFQALISAAFPVAPLACLSFAALFSQVAMGFPSAPMVAAFNQIVAAAQPEPVHLQQFIGAAQAFHLPESLIDELLRVHLP